MKNLVEKSEYKAIMHSKRANIYYLEHCRVMQKDGRVLYLTEGNKENSYWNIPIANTTVIILGTGTSITQAAVRLLAGAGVLVGFSGAGATPLLAGTEIEWLTPGNEYRPTEYVQKWCSFWYKEEKRVLAARLFQEKRCKFIKKQWERDREFEDYGIYYDDIEVSTNGFMKKINQASNVGLLLSAEANFTKALYKYVAEQLDMAGFSRDHNGGDTANDFLNYGNYLAYGLAAVALWVLGIPHGFAVMHGKTRRGALVFDVADLIKDAVVLPWSFIGASQGISEQEFRELILQKFVEYKVLDYMFDSIKEVIEQVAESEDNVL